MPAHNPGMTVDTLLLSASRGQYILTVGTHSLASPFSNSLLFIFFFSIMRHKNSPFEPLPQFTPSSPLSGHAPHFVPRVTDRRGLSPPVSSELPSQREAREPVAGTSAEGE